MVMIFSYFWRGIFLPGYPAGMAVSKFSISVPEDVAQQLATVSNISEYVTEAVRRRRRSDMLRNTFAEAGLMVTDEGVAAMGHRVSAKLTARRAKTTRSRRQAA
ncbi:hypothetical protein [Catellatospora sp. NPDC049133]|uniref:hypothetical protein n=1 Tax=Catellatospora sp. NPDC049133 TaxID=3155499 RepID=UPI0033E3038B